MILDGNGRDGETFEADVCVVGAGAAGLTLALDLAGRGVSVVLVESGGLEFQQRSHDLLDVELSGQSTEGLFRISRERFFGGTTNHWGGECRPLSPFEFQHHPWVPHSGWPISRADLDPYYVKAARLLGLPGVERHYNAQALGVADRPRLVAQSGTSMVTTMPNPVPAKYLRMGRSRREEVETSPQVQCLLNTTIVQIHPDKSGDRIVSLEGKTYEQGTLHFKARDYVLCTSAIENARLLLASDKVVAGGLGNAHDLVGRFFMIHVPNGFGRLLPRDPKAPLTQEEFLSDKYSVGWAVSPQAREKHQLQGFLAWFIRNDQAEPLPHEAAIEDLMHAPAGPEVDLAAMRRRGILVNWEQSPNPDSRVMLSGRPDALGVRKPVVHLDVTLQDLSRAQRSFELLASDIARSGHGRLYFTDITGMPILGGGGHQMGTTRMADDPRHGVTDANGRVHSLENLFIGGSSLFPTAGWQHPTFTIIALALRQADFLHSRVPRTTG